MKDYGKFVLTNSETNEALGVAGREARVEVPGYGGTRGRGVLAARPLAPGYSGSPKHRAEARVVVPGYGTYGTAPISVRITRLPNS